MLGIQRAKTIVLTALLCFSCLPPPVRAAQPASEAVILAFGDSLTAGYGLPRAQAWTSLLQKKLDSDGLPYRVVNAGISGDTTAGGLTRLQQALIRNKPKIVILELGANDGLQGLPLAQSKTNLAKMIEMSKAAGARVLLLGMMIPPNYGPVYTAQFRAIYPALAQRYRVPLVPFMLTGVAGIQSLNLGDGIHPNAQGQRIVEKNIWARLKPMLHNSKTASSHAPRLAGNR